MEPGSRSVFRFFGFLVREGSALILAGVIWYVVWGGYQPVLDTPEQAYRIALVAGIVALAYLAVQALAVVMQPLGRETGYLIDLLLSLVPLAVTGYAVVQALSGELALSYFQQGILWLAGIATAVDVVVFSWFNMRLNKLASDYVRMQ